MTNTKRMKELLAYASVCFEHQTSPFELGHLNKMNVTLHECGDLSEEISNILAENISESDLKNAQKLFEESQQ